MAKRRRAGSGVTGLVAIGGLLYFTHAGTWLGEQLGQVENGCYSALARIGNGRGAAICSAIGKGVEGAQKVASTVSSSADNVVERIKSAINGSVDLKSAVGNIHVPSNVLGLGSSEDTLLNKLQVGPQVLTSGNSVINAMDGFQLGKRLMGGDGSDTRDAIPWFKEASQIQGYGLLSQLSLGDIYRQGAPDVKSDPASAIQYYAQAHQSISLLEQSNTPQSQAILAALPASPEVVKEQLIQIIRQLKGK